MTTRRRRRWLAGVFVASIAVLAGTVLISNNASEDTSSSDATSTPSVATVERRNLVNRTTVDGKLGYTQFDVKLLAQRSGTLTWLPTEGSVVGRGARIFALDGASVIVMFGDTPMWRDLAAATADPPTAGADVRQLKDNLIALGLATAKQLGDDDTFTNATTEAVKRLQHQAGVTETGQIRLGDIAVVPEAIRVGTRLLSLGQVAAPGSEVAAITRPTRTVSIDLDASRTQIFHVGDAVDVVLPSGKSVHATVAAIAKIAKLAEQGNGGGGGGGGGGGSSKSTVTITIAITDPASVGDLDQAPVKVTITTSSVKDALTVPVRALLALSEGGYGVEVVDRRGARHVVAVETGMFNDSDDLVEIVKGDIHEGDKIVTAE